VADLSIPLPGHFDYLGVSNRTQRTSGLCCGGHILNPMTIKPIEQPIIDHRLSFTVLN